MSQRKDIASLYRDKADRAIGDLHQWFRLLSHDVRIVFCLSDVDFEMDVPMLFKVDPGDAWASAWASAV